MCIDRDLARPRHIFAQERCGGAKRCVGDKQSDGAADGGEQQGLDEQLLEHAPAPCAERRADRNLFPAVQGAREEKIPHIRAGDEENEPDSTEQHEQHRAAVAGDRFLQRDHRGAPPAIRLRKLACQPRRDRIHLGLRLHERDTALEARDTLHVVVPTTRARLGGERERDPEIASHRGPRCDRGFRRHDADDRVRLVTQFQRPSNHVRVGAELGAPEPVAQNDHVLRAGRVLFGPKGASERRPSADDVEEASAHWFRSYCSRAARAGERQLPEPAAWIHRHALERVRIALPVVELAGRNVEWSSVGRYRVHPHQPARLFEGKGTQQHRIDDAEERRVCADA